MGNTEIPNTQETLLKEKTFLACYFSVSDVRGEECETWILVVAGVMCCGPCFVSVGSVDGGWKTKGGRAHYSEACVNDSYKLLCSVDREHGEVTDGAIQENRFNDAATQKEHKGV